MSFCTKLSVSVWYFNVVITEAKCDIISVFVKFHDRPILRMNSKTAEVDSHVFIDYICSSYR